MWGSRRKKEEIPDLSPPTLPLAKFKEKPIGKRQCNSLLREIRSPLALMEPQRVQGTHILENVKHNYTSRLDSRF